MLSRGRGVWCVLMGLALATSVNAQQHSADASSQTTEPLAAIRWPARRTDHLAAIVARGADAITLSRNVLAAQGLDHDDRRGHADADWRVATLHVRVQGVVLTLRNGDEDASPAHTWLHVDFPATCGADSEHSKTDGSARAADDQLAESAARLTDDDLRRGVLWRLYEPARAARGLAVELGGNRFVRAALLKRGWAVLSSSAPGRYRARYAGETPQHLAFDSATTSVGNSLAARFDDELADWAYSLEAVLAELNEVRPEIPQRPLAMLGFSVGALGLPACAARLGDGVDAAVLVAGGADLFEIARTTAKEQMRLQWPDDLNSSGAGRSDREPLAVAQMHEAYRAAAQLDPLRTAAALRGTPVLVVHATFDVVVPAKMGDELHRLLGEPPRTVLPLGHRWLLRWGMRLYAGRVARWVEWQTAAVRN